MFSFLLDARAKTLTLGGNTVSTTTTTAGGDDSGSGGGDGSGGDGRGTIIQNDDASFTSGLGPVVLRGPVEASDDVNIRGDLLLHTAKMDTIVVRAALNASPTLFVRSCTTFGSRSYVLQTTYGTPIFGISVTPVGSPHATGRMRLSIGGSTLCYKESLGLQSAIILNVASFSFSDIPCVLFAVVDPIGGIVPNSEFIITLHLEYDVDPDPSELQVFGGS